MWVMVPEIWNETDNCFSFWDNVCPFIPPNNPENQNLEKKKKKEKKRLEMSSFYTCAPKIMIIWSMPPEIWSATDRSFCHFGPFFALLLLTPNFKTWKNLKTPGDIVYLHICTINEDMYGSWDIRCDRQSFFVILGHFLPFDPHNNPENQNFEKNEKLKKLARDIIILHLCTTNDDHMMYGSWDIECNRQNFCHFGLCFAFLPH